MEPDATGAKGRLAPIVTRELPTLVPREPVPDDNVILDQRTRLPARVPADRTLFHNDAVHTEDMPHGFNGFLCAYWIKGLEPDTFAPCPCGWAKLTHWAPKDHIKSTGGQCMTTEAFNETHDITVDDFLGNPTGRRIIRGR